MAEIEVIVEWGCEQKNVRLRVNEKHTVRSLKRQIFSEWEIDLGDQRLMFQSKDLEDYNTFEDMHITDGSTIRFEKESPDDLDTDEDEDAEIKEEKIPGNAAERKKFIKKKVREDQRAVVGIIADLAKHLEESMKNKEGSSDSEDGDAAEEPNDSPSKIKTT
ncbi:hypothetical protein AAMO2058_000863200 [Amorphochlora amoebiformis]